MADTFKIFVHGVTGCGKSTFIKAISEIDIKPGYRAEKSINEEPIDIDFGRVTIEEDKYIIYLFGYAGPQTFPKGENIIGQYEARFAYRIVANPIKTAKNEDRQYEETKAIIEKTRGRNKPYILVSSKRKDTDSYSISELRGLFELPETIPLLECDLVTDSASAKRVLVELFKLLPQDVLVQAAIEKLSEDKDDNS
jgi:uncharacterized protein